jgi:hypothetical protein
LKKPKIAKKIAVAVDIAAAEIKNRTDEEAQAIAAAVIVQEEVMATEVAAEDLIKTRNYSIITNNGN